MSMVLQHLLLLGLPAAGTGLLPAAFVWVWNTSLAVLPLIGLVLLFQVAFRKHLTSRSSYVLWLLVVLRLLMPAVPSSPCSIFRLGDPLFHSSALVPSSTALPPNPARSEGPAAPPRSQSDEAPFQIAPPLARPSAGFGTTAFMAFAPGLWLLGAAGYLLAVLIWHRRFNYLVSRQPFLASARVASILADAKTLLGLREEIRIVAIDSLRVPSLFGFLRPRLLLPARVLEQLNERELRLVLLHELIHLKRRDVLQNWLLILLQALHWFNPLVWLAFRRLRSARELVCDAAVLSYLDAGDRYAYGTTLIKMLDCFSRTPLAPSLVPILNRKSEIHRRVVMIANFKPATRLTTFISAALALTLGLFTFTAAAEKEPAKAAEVPPADLSPARQRAAQERALKLLDEEVAKRDDEIRARQKELDQLKRNLQISDSDEAGQGRTANEPQTCYRTDFLRVEAMAEFTRVDTLYRYLTNLSRSELKKAILTVTPDSPLTSLLDRLAIVEEKLAELTETYGKEHPDVRRTRANWETTNRHIEERLEGILHGLSAKRDAEKARLDILQTELEKVRKSEIEMSIQRRPYLQAKRDLENLQYVREKLLMRIMQEKIDAAMSNQP